MQGQRVVFRSPLQVELEDFDLSLERIGPWEVAVRTHCTVISPGTELARLQGKLVFDTDEPPAFPMTTVGYANIGTVLAAGERTGVRPGDRVYTMANHATVARVDMREMLCVPVPAEIDDEDAVFCRLAVVSMTTLQTTTARGGDRAGVLGLGLIGNLAAQVLQIAGMQVDGFDLSARRRDIAVASGLRSVHGPEAFGDFEQAHRLVIEATGSARAQVTAVEMTAPGGEIVMIGAPWGGDANSVPSSKLTRLIFYRFLTLRSGSEWEIPRQPQAQPPGIWSHQTNTATALGWIADGRLQVRPLVTHRIRPEEVPAAYDGLLNRPDEHLGVVIDWRGAGG
jgi:threonine dehydrogenase-like Zn-dependent dehydrogenase